MAILTTLLTLSATPSLAAEVKFCFLFCMLEQEAPVDSFCTSYLQVNKTPATAAEIKKLSRDTKVPINANDVLFLCKCKRWDNPICKDKTE